MKFKEKNNSWTKNRNKNIGEGPFFRVFLVRGGNKNLIKAQVAC